MQNNYFSKKIYSLKELVHKLAPKISFPSNAFKSIYFIIIILFHFEIEHKHYHTKKRNKKFMPMVGFEPTPVNHALI